jgi:hypothetical protein
MNPKLKKFLSAAFVILSVSIVFIIAFGNTELKDAWAALSRMDWRWIAGLFGCWAVYAGFDSLGTWFYLRREGFKISPFRTLICALIGFYYGNITPSATGGQPMQVNALRKAGIPVGYGTMAASVRFISNQFLICVTGITLLLTNRDFVYSQLGDAVWFVRIGLVCNFAPVPLIIMAAFMRTRMQKIAQAVIGFLFKIHLVRNKDIALARVTETLDDYHTAMKELSRSVGRILLQFLCSAISLAALFSTIVFVYYAFEQSGTPAFRIFTLSALLFVSASYTPLPGASGAQEGGFLLYFKGIFKPDIIGLALLIWRFFTYYLFLIVGVVTVLIEKAIVRREQKKKEQEKEKEETE